MKAKEIKFNIIKELGVIKEGKYSKEVNLVSWSEKKPVYDIRNINNDENGTKIPLKGISLSLEEIRILKDILDNTELEEL
ncbi:MAG: hypothetical protein HFG30_07955 [Eubacterium sp.]|jgi:hypothetical protein|nr:hypothetical protein [Eubacterium sp.]